MLAMSKLNTISDLVSAALMDGHISDQEFKLIMNEVLKYTQMKADIRSKASKSYKSITISESEKMRHYVRNQFDALPNLDIGTTY